MHLPNLSGGVERRFAYGRVYRAIGPSAKDPDPDRHKKQPAPVDCVGTCTVDDDCLTGCQCSSRKCVPK
jgi:hypothetical protein